MNGFIKRKRKIHLFGFIKKAFFGFIVFLLLLGGYEYRSVKRLEHQLGRSLKWDIPSKIYSDAAYYYPGLSIDLLEFKRKLERLEYRERTDKVEGQGEYVIKDGTILLYLRDFEYPTEKFLGFPIRIETSEGVIKSISRLDTGESLSSFKLEPELIARIFGPSMEDRTLVKLDEVPSYLKDAIILIEDERFYKHIGIDPAAILRAIIKDITSFKIVEGGSTLTQQLVKNYFLTSKRSFSRKIEEAIISVILELKHSKDEILEAYLNEIYLGQRGTSSVSGVGEASRLYFGKDVSQLTVAEAALLAGMIRAPKRYNPFLQKDSAMERRNFVLKRMYEAHYISKDDYEKAIREPILTPTRTARTNLAPYFTDYVKNEIASAYSEDVLTKEGLRIFTTLDVSHQLAAERVVKEEIERLERDYASILPKDKVGELQGALISIQPQTGYIRAMVGGRDYEKSQFNHISQALRQTGSTFKPFVYLSAFDPTRGGAFYAPSSIISDRSFNVEVGGKEWSPQNYDKMEHGDVSLREALAYSYNIATARLALSIGLDAVVDVARRAGIKSELSPVPSLALGAFEVTPLEMAYAYSIFPNGGIRAEPISVISVVTRDGKVLERKNMEMKRVFDPKPVYLTTSVLKDVLEYGTAAAARKLGFHGIAAGKTGTTDNYRDAWFVGFTPDYLALAWVGYDDNTPINMSGARAALPIWVRFMKEVVGDSKKDFTSPDGIILVKVDKNTGLLASPKCGEGVYDLFIEGTEPEESCLTRLGR